MPPRVGIVALSSPVPARVDGQPVLVYELTVTNYGNATCNLTSVDVRDEQDRSLLELEGETLYNAYLHKRWAGQLWPGAGQTVMLWVPWSGQPPSQLRHRLELNGQSVEGPPLAVLGGPLPILGLPMAGAGRWLAGNGPSNESNHRRTILAVGGNPYLSQRFAIDWLKVDARNQSYQGDPLDNRSYYCYGAEVLAVADGTVIELRDGIPENVPGLDSRAVEIEPDTVGGNSLGLDLGQGLYARYAHLIPGSLRVSLGQRVKRGQVLGRVGNSGNSTEPHLHFHLADQPNWLQSQGLPYLLEGYRLLGPEGESQEHRHDLPSERQILLLP